jgi:hypothetical protein
MAERTARLQQALAALDSGDLGELEDLFVEDARWLGVTGGGWDGQTPI